MIRFGDSIEALEGTTTAIFAEGRTGVVVSAPSGRSSRGLVRWGDETILMGFHAENVRVVQEAAHPVALSAQWTPEGLVYHAVWDIYRNG